MPSESTSDVDLRAAEILGQLWPRVVKAKLESDEYARLRTFVKTKARRFLNSGQYSSPNTASGYLVQIIDEVKKSSAAARRDVLWDVKQKFFSGSTVPDYKVSSAIDMAASLWLTLDVRCPASGITPGQGIVSDLTTVSWPDDQSLATVVSSHFEISRDSQEKMNKVTRVNHDLTMANLHDNYLFGICWTHNLAEHLRVDWDHKTITIYEHKVALWNHLQFNHPDVLPTALVEEALDTINLLFPFDHAPTEALLKRLKVHFYGLGNCGRPRALDLSRYTHWRDRMEELHHILDEPPTGIHQLALDRGRKNLYQFATFWVATAVAILTISSFVTGVYSTIYAKKQYDLAFLQYQLSLAQACATSEAAAQLPGFCS